MKIKGKIMAFVLASCMMTANVTGAEKIPGAVETLPSVSNPKSYATYTHIGDFGFWGGISDGRKLPKTTELLADTKKNSSDKLESVYKEMIFISGKPVEFNGNITVNNKAKADPTVTNGTYKVDYKIESGNTTPEGVDISRNINYEVSYRNEGRQTISDYKVTSWKESITSDGATYTLDDDLSKSSISVIQDKTPGVSYYKGNLSNRMVYTSNDDTITVDMNGTFYGYACAYSSTETYRIDCTITASDWQMQYQIRPSVSMGKTLNYTNNEPTAISFDGNYQEIMSNQSGMSYNIYMPPSKFTNVIPQTGSMSIDSFNDFEQLIAPDVSYLKGHFAEDDIKRLFSMQILDGEASFYQPSQAITRGQFVEMLVKAIKLPVEETTTKKTSSKKQTINLVFPDVVPEREDYKYIMAAYNAGLAVGRDNGYFYADSPIERQEAIVILLRTLGLENLGLDPTPITPFTDTNQIASWATREVYAAQRLGIVSGDEDFNFKPLNNVTKAEAAALVNRLNNYMRTDLQTDYTEHIVNYAD